MQAFSRPVDLAPGAVVGGAKPTLLAGPCVVESYDICARIAGAVKEAALRHGFDYVFKASFDKANRTSVKSFRSIGLDAALEVLARIRAEFEVPVAR